MVGVTAVLLRYWAQRDENLPTIIADLQAGATAPDEIVVVDQGSPPLTVDCEVPVIRLPRNFGTRARYVIGLLFPTPYLLFVDDDTTVEYTTLRDMMSVVRPGRVVTIRGEFDGAVLPQSWPSPVDWLIGRLHLAHREALVRMLAAEPRYRTGPLASSDYADSLLGWVNDCVSIPAEFGELPTFGVGLDKTQEQDRDRRREVLDHIRQTDR